MESSEGSHPPAIGRALAQARAERGLELRQVEAETKIRIKYLQALEDEDWRALPDPAYAIGFLRTYAELLGLDADALVGELRGRLDGDPGTEQRYPAGEPLLTGRERTAPPRRWLRLVLIAAALVLVAAVALALLGGFGNDDGPGADRKGGGGRGDGQARADGREPAQQESSGPVVLELSLRADVPVCLLGEGPAPLIDNQVLNAGSEERFEAERYQLRFPQGFERSQLRLELDGERVRLEPSLEPAAFTIRGPEDVRPTDVRGGDCP
jgi:hypothetical protein